MLLIVHVVAVSKFDIPEAFDLFPVSCQNSIRRDICANAFGKCVNGSDGYDIYPNITVNDIPFSVPFQRPCENLCVDIQLTCTGLPALLGYIPPDCNQRIDYSGGSISSFFPYKYDPSNNVSVCNDMGKNGSIVIPVDLVGTNIEPYMHANNSDGACYGVTDFVYIPPVNTLDALGVVTNETMVYSPLQPPFAVQSVLESTLLDVFDSVPLWLSRKCFLAMKRYMCNHFMGEAVAISLLDAQFDSSEFGANYSLLNWISNATKQHNITGEYNFTDDISKLSLSAPINQNLDLCYLYASECGDFLSMVNTTQLMTIHSHLVPQCKSITALPTFALNITLHSNIVVDGLLYEANNTNWFREQISYSTSLGHRRNYSFEADVISYNPTCPSHFFPPRTLYPNTVMIKGTGCAKGCKTPRMSPTEWQSLRRINIALSFSGVVLMFFLILTWSLHPIKKQQYLVIDFMLFTFTNGIIVLVGLMLPYEEHFCNDETSHVYDTEDTLSYCFVSGLLRGMVTFCVILSWWAVSEQTLRKLQGKAEIPLLMLECAIFGFALIRSCIIAFTVNYSAPEIIPICLPGARSEYIFIGLLPWAMIALFGFVNLCRICYIVYKRIAFTPSSPEKTSALLVLAGPLRFLMLIFTVYLGAVIQGVVVSKNSDTLVESWMECVFYEDWRGSYSTWTNPVCGAHHEGRRSIGQMVIATAAVYMTGLWTFIIYSVDFFYIWRDWLGGSQAYKRELPVSVSSLLFNTRVHMVQPHVTPVLTSHSSENLKPISDESLELPFDGHDNGSGNGNRTSSIVYPYQELEICEPI